MHGSFLRSKIGYNKGIAIRWKEVIMARFIAFDVETPNRFSDRMSAIGISVIENGAVADSYYSLVNPETHFDYFNVQLTGISEASVRHAPTFPEVWEEIAPLMESGLLVAHNAVFDMGGAEKMPYGLRHRMEARGPLSLHGADGKAPVTRHEP